MASKLAPARAREPVVHGKELGVALTDCEKFIRAEELRASPKPAGALRCHDELQIWRERHLMWVYRVIDRTRRIGTPSLQAKHGGSGLHGMKQRFSPKFWPMLWDIRDQVFSAWLPAQAAQGHDPGYHG